MLYNPVVLFLRQPEIIVVRFKQRIAFRELDKIRRGVLIKVPDVILKELASMNDISQIFTLLRRGGAHSILQSHCGGHGMSC